MTTPSEEPSDGVLIDCFSPAMKASADRLYDLIKAEGVDPWDFLGRIILPMILSELHAGHWTDADCRKAINNVAILAGIKKSAAGAGLRAGEWEQ